jgi:predicted Zn-dependent peptidase
MTGRWTIAAVLAVALGAPAAVAKDAKPKKDARTEAKSAIPARPEQLRPVPLVFDVPDAQKFRHQLSNGIPVYVVEDHTLPLVDVSLTVRLGAFLDPRDKPGLASLTTRMMRRGGTASLSPDAFDERADFLAANLGAQAGDTSGGASVSCITGVIDDALALFFEMQRAPRFDEERLRIEKSQILEQLRHADISSREWAWLLRGRSHFSSRQPTQAELDAVTRTDLATFHRQYWRPENMILAVSGDVTPEAILPKLEKHFAGWSVDGPPVPWPPTGPDVVPAAGVYYVEKDIPQGRTRIGHLGTQRRSWDEPEAFDLLIMNDILGGGGFTSRIMKRIRSDEGLAYGASSAFGVGLYWPGTFQVSFQSKSPTVAYASKIALAEIERMRTELVSDEELSVSKKGFIDAFPRRFESAAQIAATFASDEYEGRPQGYWKTYRDNVAAVTAERVRAAARKHLDPSKLVFLIVGKWEDIEPGDADRRASMGEFNGGRATKLPLRDPLTLEPVQ